MPEFLPRRPEDHPALPPARDWPDAFGTGRPRPPGYEAFGRAENDTHKKPPPRARQDSPAPAKEKSPSQPHPDKPADTTDDRREKESPDNQDKVAEHDNNDKKDQSDTPDHKKPPAYKRPAVLITTAAILLIAIIAALLWWLHARQFQTTDDAYIDSHVTVIAPQVSALVKTLHVDDNQFVHKGDLLIELDPTDFQVALEQAQANAAAAEGRLAQANAQVTVANAALEQAAAEVDAAQVNLDNSAHDLHRYQNIDERARSQQQLDNATTAQKNAQAQLTQAQAKRTSAKANITSAQASVKTAAGELAKASADVHHATINLGYTKITAPSDGRVTLRTLEPGAYIAAGQAAFSLVSPDVWVTANFKETQLKLMRPGQSVSITVDAYPKKKFTGKIDSIQAGSGSRFSVLPAENATGNFVKIVQRVPVKILLDHDPNTQDTTLLSPGLSVTPKVKVR